MVRSSSYSPRLTALENRLQPGSIFTGILDTSLLAGGLGLLGQSLLAPASQVSEPAQTGTTQQAARADLGAADLFVPVAGSASAKPLDTVQAQPLVSDDLVHAVLSTGAPVNKIGGASITGGACEEAGNVVVNGDFETVPPPGVWFQIGDPYAGYVIGGGHMTPDRHLRVGAVGNPGLVYQEVFTEPDVIYTIRISANTDEGGPQAFVVVWNREVVADITFDLTSEYQRFEFVASVVGTGFDELGFFEQHDPLYVHIDDVCVTPYVE